MAEATAVEPAAPAQDEFRENVPPQPVQRQEPAAEQPAKSEAQPEPKGDEGEDDHADDSQGQEPRKKGGGFQDRIGKLTRVNADQARLIERQQQQLDRALEALAKVGGASAASPAVQQEPKSEAPKREDFDSYEDFIDARAAHNAAQATRKVLAEREEQVTRDAQAKQQEAERTSFETSLAQRMAKGQEKYEDFAEVAQADHVPITKAMAEVIAASDTGEDIAYFLGRNLDEATRISKLSPALQAHALGTIEASLRAKPKSSAAPAPAKPISSTGSTGQDFEALDHEAYRAKRKAQGATWARY